MNFKFKLSRRLARMKLGAMIAGTLVGCSLGSGPEVVRIDSITIAPGRFTLLPSQSADLTVVALTSHGDSGETASLRWITTGGVITSNFPVGGVRHITYQSAVQPGNYLLIATTASGWPADTAHISVTATPVSVNAVTVAPGSVSLAVRDTVTLRATLMDSSGSVLVGRAITWSASDPSVVAVLATGWVHAVAVGTATITASCEGRSGTSVITVR